VRLAKQMGVGNTIVTVLCDGGARYQSRLFDPAWLATKGLVIERQLAQLNNC
jgi:cysteine synthase